MSVHVGFEDGREVGPRPTLRALFSTAAMRVGVGLQASRIPKELEACFALKLRLRIFYRRRSPVSDRPDGLGSSSERRPFSAPLGALPQRASNQLREHQLCRQEPSGPIYVEQARTTDGGP